LFAPGFYFVKIAVIEWLEVGMDIVGGDDPDGFCCKEKIPRKNQ
jgi:hypothetical protein